MLQKKLSQGNTEEKLDTASSSKGKRRDSNSEKPLPSNKPERYHPLPAAPPVSSPINLPVGFFDDSKVDATFQGFTKQEIQRQSELLKDEEEKKEKEKQKMIQDMLETDSYRATIEEAHKQDQLEELVQKLKRDVQQIRDEEDSDDNSSQEVKSTQNKSTGKKQPEQPHSESVRQENAKNPKPSSFNTPTKQSDDNGEEFFAGCDDFVT